ncbi:hypothetical protein DYB32_005723 [Aphanomyces invadans]|uniref:Uncharacterized protein n=2 Tax=Aphanomyces invadans TaxID=157072 RepID=A0A3R6V9P8_9STRA|nr:hypothetical protein DYB32_005723 [Aphanomyces invadans]
MASSPAFPSAMVCDPCGRVGTKRPRAAKAAISDDNEQEGTGMWTTAEHIRFLEGVAKFPKGPWKYVAEIVQTRTVRQIRTHAQKYREKQARHRRGLRFKPSTTSTSSDDSDDARSSVDPVAVEDVAVVANTYDWNLDPLPFSSSPIQLDECMSFLLEAFPETAF